MIKLERYTNLYLSTLYAENNKPYGAGKVIVKLMKSREVSGGLILEVTDGHKLFKQVDCLTLGQAKKEFKTYCKQYLT